MRAATARVDLVVPFGPFLQSFHVKHGSRAVSGGTLDRIRWVEPSCFT
jgi:hypothetical protein